MLPSQSASSTRLILLVLPPTSARFECVAQAVEIEIQGFVWVLRIVPNRGLAIARTSPAGRLASTAPFEGVDELEMPPEGVDSMSVTIAGGESDEETYSTWRSSASYFPVRISTTS